MDDVDPRSGPGRGRTALPSAAPATGPRVLAVAAIVVAGVCGGLIGYGVVDLQSDGSATAGPLIGGVVGAVAAAAGVAVVAVLVLRAMTEWQAVEDRAANGSAPPGARRRDRG
mgnify:CR=1 FL=1